MTNINYKKPNKDTISLGCVYENPNNRPISGRGCVYDINGIAPTILTMGGGVINLVSL